MGLRIKSAARLAGITEKRWIDVEKMPEPVVTEVTYHGLARALEINPQRMNEQWRAEPVPIPTLRDRSGPPGLRIIRVPQVSYAGLRRLAAINREHSVDAFVERIGLEGRIVTRGRRDDSIDPANGETPHAPRRSARPRPER